MQGTLFMSSDELASFVQTQTERGFTLLGVRQHSEACLACGGTVYAWVYAGVWNRFQAHRCSECKRCWATWERAE